MGRTIALYSDTGAGKTTQAGEWAKDVFKRTGKRSVLHQADMGGHDSIDPLIELGVIELDPLNEFDDPWVWTNRVVSTKREDVGLHIYDSGTGLSEALLLSCAKMSAAGEDIGGRPAPKIILNKHAGVDKQLRLGSNVDTHYGVVQNFMLDMIWKSTWLTKGHECDVIWTFAVHRGEGVEQNPVLGPKLAGKALTAAIPKWFNYTFRLVSQAIIGEVPKHILYLQEQPDNAGISTSFGNSRYPLDASSVLPATIEPASIVEALRLIDQGKEEAKESLRISLGL